MTKENNEETVFRLTSIYTALQKCEFKKVTVKGSNAMFNAKYMKVADMLPVIEKELQKHDIICIGTMKVNEHNSPILNIQLRHIPSDTFIESECICLDDTKKGSQQIGSGITYMTRYILQRLLNLVPDESTDDDGNESSKSGGFKPQQPRKVIRKGDNYGI
tara:strand:- start:439 stop:921 length:483 start_codon:yes stop_codon:yes gene_type:complete